MERTTNSKVLFRSLVNAITLDESKEEIESVVFALLHGRKGVTRAEILTGIEVNWTNQDFADDIRRINAHEPIQYILGIAAFYGRDFIVDKHVLIPRPETELLVDETLIQVSRLGRSANILDIGTGSGCIAISVALESRSSTVTAFDVSDEALKVAEQNAEKLGAKVHFMKRDILDKASWQGSWDLIVSNPPYVRLGEAKTMKKNVKDFEPHLALFVPDTDPLLFYSAIARAGLVVLSEDGAIVAEINEKLGGETCALFSSFGYRTSIVKDLDGKDRIIIALRRQIGP